MVGIRGGVGARANQLDALHMAGKQSICQPAKRACSTCLYGLCGAGIMSVDEVLVIPDAADQTLTEACQYYPQEANPR